MSLPDFNLVGLGQREPEFLAWAAILLAYDIKSYVELGTGHGSYIARMGIPSVVCVDINNESSNRTLRADGTYHVRGSSYDIATLREVTDILGGFPDCVFIDADHDNDAPRRDFDLWYPVAKKLVGFHDINIPNIRHNIWPQIAFRYKSAEIIGRDLASAIAWQGPGTSPDGFVSGGGIGVIYK